MRDKELTGTSPCLAVCRILIATFQRLMNKPHSHKTKKSLVEPSPGALEERWKPYWPRMSPRPWQKRRPYVFPRTAAAIRWNCSHLEAAAADEFPTD